MTANNRVDDLRRERPDFDVRRYRPGQRRYGGRDPLRQLDDGGHIEIERRQRHHHPGIARRRQQLHHQFTAGTLTINPAGLEVTANNLSMVYGGRFPTLTFVTTGLVNGDTVASALTGSLTTSGTSTSRRPQLPHHSGLADGRQLHHHVHAGQPRHHSGRARCDREQPVDDLRRNGSRSDLRRHGTGQRRYAKCGSLRSVTTTGSSHSNVGSDPITQGTLASNRNYTLTFTPGTLTITPAALDVMASNQSMTYGGIVSTLTFTVTGLVNGDTEGEFCIRRLTTTGSSHSNAGSDNIAQGSLSLRQQLHHHVHTRDAHHQPGRARGDGEQPVDGLWREVPHSDLCHDGIG